MSNGGSKRGRRDERKRFNARLVLAALVRTTECEVGHSSHSPLSTLGKFAGKTKPTDAIPLWSWVVKGLFRNSQSL